MAQVERLDRVAGALADDVELALEGVLVRVAGSPGDKDLADDRLDFLRPQREAAVVGGHVAPAEKQLSFGVDCALDFLLARHAGRGFPRQEHHADAVLPDGRQRNAKFSARTAEKEVGQLDQDAGAVALERVGAGRATVGQVFKNPQSMLDDRMVLSALDMRDKAQSARVVFAVQGRTFPGFGAAMASMQQMCVPRCPHPVRFVLTKCLPPLDCGHFGIFRSETG